MCTTNSTKLKSVTERKGSNNVSRHVSWELRKVDSKLHRRMREIVVPGEQAIGKHAMWREVESLGNKARQKGQDSRG